METHLFIMDQLSDWSQIVARRMFGGYGLSKDKVTFCLILKGESVYFRVDAVNRPDFDALDSEAFAYEASDRQGGKKEVVVNSYWRVPDEILEDRDSLCNWAQKAYGAALRAVKPSKAKPSKPPKAQSLGPKSMALLKTIGIESIEDLRQEGAISAYRRLVAQSPKSANLNLLWGMYATANGMDYKALTPDDKDMIKGLVAD